MKKDKLMQEFKNLKIGNDNNLFGGQTGDGDTICDVTTNYTTNPGGSTDTKTDKITDDKEPYFPADNTRVQLPYVFPIYP